ncbi:MAG TPA: hypothetical protein VH085_09590 [Nocardioides sp.]|nr:hypothetical protein [Nocardioides sp.]
MAQGGGSARDFDFWVGDWDVYGPQGRQVGRNTIALLFDGGALSEHWRGDGGVEGHSLNAYDPSAERWHQTWVDSTGGLLLLDGGLADGSMVLEGAAPGQGGALERQRITWTPEDAGVRQHWESSTDDGVSWQTAFDGHYHPHSA